MVALAPHSQRKKRAEIAPHTTRIPVNTATSSQRSDHGSPTQAGQDAPDAALEPHIVGKLPDDHEGDDTRQRHDPAGGHVRDAVLVPWRQARSNTTRPALHVARTEISPRDAGGTADGS